jgi:gliding motility-associated-like protein
VQWGNTRGIFPLGVREWQGTCSGDWAYLNVAVIGTQIKFNRDNYVLCTDSVQVGFNESDFQGWHWSDSSINNNIITHPGTYTLQAFDKHGCLTSKSVTISDGPHVDLGTDTIICVPDYRLNASRIDNPDGTKYIWSTGSTAPYIVINPSDQDTPIWVKAMLNACSVSDSVIILACKPLSELRREIPNTFTPNADGDNDTWRIDLLKKYPQAQVEVYDRWNRRVFLSARGYPTEWDGRDRNGKALPLETYYYIIHLNDGVHNKPILGTITIVK